MRPLRWLFVVIPVVVVAIIELVSDVVFDKVFPFPFDTIVIAVIVAILAWGFTGVAFRRIDRLSAELRARNADLERREASARALHRVSVAIAALADLDEILGAIVDQARERLDVDIAVLLAYGTDGDAYVAAASGPADGVDRAGGYPGVDVARFVRPDLTTARFEAPLQRAGETIGLLMVGSRIERSFEVDEVETLSALANQAAIATENARLQARLRELAVIAERERIAREMHDGLAQVLGYVNTKSQAIEELLVAGRTDEARGLLAELAAAARSIYVDVREAILGLRSPVVPGLGLVAAVEDYGARFSEASKIVVRVDAPAGAHGLELAPDVEAQVFRIVQEALTNVRKHARGAPATVDLDWEPGRLRLRVADHGPGANGSAQGHGLVGMRERVKVHGGELHTGTANGGGFVVQAELPLP
jgi:signal transduction histidine kinase